MRTDEKEMMKIKRKEKKVNTKLLVHLVLGDTLEIDFGTNNGEFTSERLEGLLRHLVIAII